MSKQIENKGKRSWRTHHRAETLATLENPKPASRHSPRSSASPVTWPFISRQKNINGRIEIWMILTVREMRRGLRFFPSSDGPGGWANRGPLLDTYRSTRFHQQMMRNFFVHRTRCKKSKLTCTIFFLIGSSRSKLARQSDGTCIKYRKSGYQRDKNQFLIKSFDCLFLPKNIFFSQDSIENKLYFMLIILKYFKIIIIIIFANILSANLRNKMVSVSNRRFVLLFKDKISF